MDHIRYMEATLRPDAPPFMEMMLLFMRSRVEEGIEYMGDLYPISGTLEESDILRMTPEGGWITEQNTLTSCQGNYSAQHLDPVYHMFHRIVNLLKRLETIIKKHDSSYESVANDDNDEEDDDDDESYTGDDEVEDESEDESNANSETYTQRVLRLTGWSWDMIRAYLSLLEEYLTNIGSSMDDFMNCKSSLLSSLFALTCLI